MTIEERLAELENKFAAMSVAQRAAGDPSGYYTSIYSGEQIDAAIGNVLNVGNNPIAIKNIGAAPRRNLVDNGYFVGGGSQQGGGQFPINQRGQTSYGAASGYGIDRWFNGAIALTPQGLKMSSATILYQRLENTEIFTGETLTYSVLWSDGKLLTITGTPDQMQVVNDGDRSIQFAIDSSLSILWVSIQSLDATEKTAVAAKLEFGPTQTIAYQDEEGNWQLFETPDYAEELAKCQRYAQFGPLIGLPVIPGYVSVPLLTTLRTSPVFEGSAQLYKTSDNSPLGERTLTVNQMWNNVISCNAGVS